MKQRPYTATVFLKDNIQFEFKLAAQNKELALVKAEEQWYKLYGCGKNSLKSIKVVPSSEPVRYIF